MKISDAAKLLNLSGDINPELVKSAYRRAASKFHPDRNPAGGEMMKAINEANELLQEHTGTINQTDMEGYDASTYGDDLMDALNAIIELPGLKIEVCGAWVWVTGDTKPHAKALGKEGAGFFFASKKKSWYYRPRDWKSSSRGAMDMEEIRERHGSSILKSKGRRSLQGVASHG